METFTAETWIGEIGDNSPFAMADLGVCLFTARAQMIKRSEVLRLLGSATGHSGQLLVSSPLLSATVACMIKDMLATLILRFPVLESPHSD